MDLVNIDLWSSTSFDNGHPHEQYRWLRVHDPVHWHEEPGGRGFWAVMRYRDVKAVGHDPEVFSSRSGMLMQDFPEGALEGSHQMIFMDPPLHTRYRLLVNKGFTPRGAQRLEPRIQRLARRIVDEVIERGECDFVPDVAGKLPSYFIADLLGFPLEDGVRLYEATEKIHSAPDAVSDEDRAEAGAELGAYATRVWDDKHEHPGDDLATQLIQAEIDGDRLSQEDFLQFFALLVNAGGDTTRNLVGGGMLALFEHPDERLRLQSSLEEQLPAAVEEMLRWVSPVVYMRRTAMCDTELGGKRIKAGDKVIMYYGSANRDEEVFADPDRFDVGRASNEHAAFGGGGPHFCLGAHVARMEIQAIFREVLTRMPDVQQAGDAQWLASNFVSGPTHLPVQFSPGPPRGDATS